MNFDFEDTRRKLISLRSKLGADTPAGHRCSNPVEQLQAHRQAASQEQIQHLNGGIRRQMAELNALAAAANATH